MNTNQFGTKSPGRLIAIASADRAFLPDPLPPKGPFPAKLWPLLARAKEKIALLEGVGRTLPDPSLLLQPLVSREAIQSSRLEGTYATPRELFLFEMDPSKSPDDDRRNEWLEVSNCKRALAHAFATSLPLSLRLTREIHAILMGGVHGPEKTPGEFRKIQVAIGSNKRYIPPPPERLDECLREFELSLHRPSEFDPLVDCMMAHYQFEAIHPFIDGNGRVGRLLLALHICNRCDLTKPWLLVSEFFERNKEEYCKRLFEVSTRGAWMPWVEFCLRGAIETAEATVLRCDRLQNLREEFMSRLSAVGGSVRLSAIVLDLFRSPYVWIADVAKKLGVTYPTAKADIDRLIRAKILERLPGETSQNTYYSPELFRIAYADIDAAPD